MRDSKPSSYILLIKELYKLFNLKSFLLRVDRSLSTTYFNLSRKSVVTLKLLHLSVSQASAARPMFRLQFYKCCQLLFVCLSTLSLLVLLPSSLQSNTINAPWLVYLEWLEHSTWKLGISCSIHLSYRYMFPHYLLPMVVRISKGKTTLCFIIFLYNL